MFPSPVRGDDARSAGPVHAFGAPSAIAERQDDAPRIGVFICHCGHNIAGYLDMQELVESARALPNVIVAVDSLFACSDSGLAEIRAAVAQHKLNRVVVASCTPRTHEPLFQANIEEAGLDRYLFEFVNIRDQCSWVHINERDRATQKAKDLIRMGVAKATLLQPLEEAELPVHPAAAVIGGGMAGMTAALSLARRGFSVTLVEREEELGGLLLQLDRLYPTGESARDLVRSHAAEVRSHPNIEVLASSELLEVRGYIGSFELLVHNRDLGMDLPVRAGVIIVATGAQEFRPEGMHGYGQDNAVVTQLDLEHHLAVGSLPPSLATVVMIQCVGARDENHAYCGRTCCLTAIKNAIQLKERVPGVEVHILYRDIEAYGAHFEEYYSAARDQGVIFSRYRHGDDPQVDPSARRVIVYDEMLGANLSIPFDLVVLSAPMVPRPGTREIAKMLKVPVDEYGFFLEAHVKLRPLDFATDGIYLCGSAHWPGHLDEIIGQAYGAAARAATVLSKDQIRATGVVARVIEHLCRGCERCAEVCEFGAIQLVEPEAEGTLHGLASGECRSAGWTVDAHRVARVNPVLCKGCGACAVVCPTSAMQALHFTDRQVTAMVQAALGG